MYKHVFWGLQPPVPYIEVSLGTITAVVDMDMYRIAGLFGGKNFSKMHF